jgi:hypothetical protein
MSLSCPQRTIVVCIVGIISGTAPGSSTRSTGWGLLWSVALARPGGGLVNRLGGGLGFPVGIEFGVVACEEVKVSGRVSCAR